MAETEVAATKAKWSHESTAKDALAERDAAHQQTVHELRKELTALQSARAVLEEELSSEKASSFELQSAVTRLSRERGDMQQNLARNTKITEYLYITSVHHTTAL